MNKIKSKMAECYILNHSAHRDSKEGKEMGVVTTYVDATKAVLIAEQEAEDRAKKAFCKATCNYGLYCEERNCHDMRAFIESLNNGGQSDE